ncbi:unnamed protein product, partial [Closterium sp. Naga37s-1]
MDPLRHVSSPPPSTSKAFSSLSLRSPTPFSHPLHARASRFSRNQSQQQLATDEEFGAVVRGRFGIRLGADDVRAMPPVPREPPLGDVCLGGHSWEGGEWGGVRGSLGGEEEGDVNGRFQEGEQVERVAVLTGAGVSAASGVPTFRGVGGLWRTYDATVGAMPRMPAHLSPSPFSSLRPQELATPQAFAADPSLVWEFYHYRRCLPLPLPQVPPSTTTAGASLYHYRRCLPLPLPQVPPSTTTAGASLYHYRRCLPLPLPQVPPSTTTAGASLYHYRRCLPLPLPQVPPSTTTAGASLYHYRRSVVARCTPNAGHEALVQLEQRCQQQGKAFTLLTQVP